MRSKTKLTVIISEDTEQDFKVFGVEDLEENDDSATIGGDAKGNLTLATSPNAGYDLTLDIAPLTEIKNLVALVNGEVEVRLNGTATGFKVKSTGTFGESNFIYGKLLIRGDEIDEVRFINQSTTATAKIMVGYAG